METGLMITLAGFIFVVIVQIVIVARWSGKTTQSIESLKHDVNRLGIKQDKHNRLIERVYIVEGETKAQDERIRRIEQNGD